MHYGKTTDIQHFVKEYFPTSQGYTFHFVRLTLVFTIVL